MYVSDAMFSAERLEAIRILHKQTRSLEQQVVNATETSRLLEEKLDEALAAEASLQTALKRASKERRDEAAIHVRS